MGRAVKILSLKLCVQHQRSNTPRFKFKITTKNSASHIQDNPKELLYNKKPLKTTLTKLQVVRRSATGDISDGASY